MFGNMKEMLKQAQNMKSQMKKIKKELESIEVEGCLLYTSDAADE